MVRIRPAEVWRIVGYGAEFDEIDDPGAYNFGAATTARSESAKWPEKSARLRSAQEYFKQGT
jgi:hypothetical protein